MAAAPKLLTDAQWNRIAPLLPEPKRSPKRGPNFIPNRRWFEGILWIPWTGAQWRALPKEYPSPTTCWRRLKRRDQLRWDETFIDAMFAPAKKRGLGVGKTKKGKGTKVVVVPDGQGLPVGHHACSASPHESTLAETTVTATHGRPQRLIGDGAYDSDPLRKRLVEIGIELIAPHRKNRKRPPTQDGWALRRYKRRWKIERVCAWLNNYRKLVVRWDYDPEIYRAFLLVGFIMILVKQL